jgi:hypothetical protein
MARILPVDGCRTTIELPACMPTALRAAASARGSIVVPTLGMLFGAMTTAWLLATGCPVAVWISTYRPGLPWAVVPFCSSNCAILSSPLSP